MLEAVKNDEKSDCQRIAYITIRGEKFGFDKVLKMIDDRRSRALQEDSASQHSQALTLLEAVKNEKKSDLSTTTEEPSYEMVFEEGFSFLQAL